MFGKKKAVNEEEKNTEDTQQEQNTAGAEAEAQADANAEQGSESDKNAGYPSPEEKYNELYDKYLRLYSDFENFRKRAQRERVEMIGSASKDVLMQVLPVYDDFERAMLAVDNGADLQSVTEGFKLIFNKFKNILNQAGLKEIEAVGAEFDSELHDAITSIPAPTPELKGKVVDQIQKGYMLNDKVVRHSKVVVGE